MKAKLFLFMMLLSTLSLFAQTEKLFDPTEDPFEDLKVTVDEATKLNKRIILDVGGDWCVWCHRIDTFMHSTEEIESLLNEHFIILKINFSKENKNEKFLSQYPAIEGYPHFFVLEKDGSLLHSQNTGELEKDKDYDKDKFVAFLKKWKSGKNN